MGTRKWEEHRGDAGATNFIKKAGWSAVKAGNQPFYFSLKGIGRGGLGERL
jgi:hypothetical protein